MDALGLQPNTCPTTHPTISGEQARREFRATAAAPAAGVRCIVAGRWCLVDSGAKCLALQLALNFLPILSGWDFLPILLGWGPNGPPP